MGNRNSALPCDSSYVYEKLCVHLFGEVTDENMIKTREKLKEYYQSQSSAKEFFEKVKVKGQNESWKVGK